MDTTIPAIYLFNWGGLFQLNLPNANAAAFRVSSVEKAQNHVVFGCNLGPGLP